MNELQYSNNTDGDIEMEHTFELFSIVLILCCVGSGLCSSINNKVNQYCETKRNSKLLDDNFLSIEDIESPTERECSVCLEPLKNSNELIQLLCGHIFHKDCVYKWISEKNTCPNCRKSIIKR